MWFIGAVLLGLAGYALYLAGLRRHLVEPNRASWLIWSSATGIEAATYAAVNPGAPQATIFALSALACILVTLVMWRRSRWRAPDAGESLCMGASLAALLLWIAFRDAFWAHLLVVAAVPVSFWPTWRSVWEDADRERSPAWGLWTMGDLATLIVAMRNPGGGTGEYVYIFVELLCHASIWLMIGLPSINPRRSLGRAVGTLQIRDARPSYGNPFAVRDNHLGKAVYATAGFAQGSTIIRFSGPSVPAAQVPATLAGSADRFMQIAADTYLGPSGRIDDLINHSCAPNAGLHFTGQGVFLVAIRAIAAGEEIAWDYSTTLADPDWRMPCACGAPGCRGTIAHFGTLPADRRAWYLERGLVAPHLIPREARAA